MQLLGGRHGILPYVKHISDHSPVFVQIYLQKMKGTGVIPFNTTLLKDEDSKNKMLASWDSCTKQASQRSAADRLSRALRAIKKESDDISKQKRQERKDSYDSQFTEIREAEKTLTQDWYNLAA